MLMPATQRPENQNVSRQKRLRYWDEKKRFIKGVGYIKGGGVEELEAAYHVVRVTTVMSDAAWFSLYLSVL